MMVLRVRTTIFSARVTSPRRARRRAAARGAPSRLAAMARTTRPLLRRRRGDSRAKTPRPSRASTSRPISSRIRRKMRVRARVLRRHGPTARRPLRRLLALTPMRTSACRTWVATKRRRWRARRNGRRRRECLTMMTRTRTRTALLLRLLLLLRRTTSNTMRFGGGLAATFWPKCRIN